MRLLRAEMWKLNRPLTWWLTVFAVAFCLLLAEGAANNAHLDSAPDTTVTTCSDLAQIGGQPLTAQQCAADQAAERERAKLIAANGNRAASGVANALSPAAVGAEAAGLLASMPGALLIALLAGGHMGGEWSGRTLKNLLVQRGRRYQVAGMKALSMWLAAVGILATCWAALAVCGSVFARFNRLPASTESVADGLRQSGAATARALLVLVFFVLVGLLAGVLTRSTVGTITAAIGAMVALLAFATLPTVGKWTPATWVEAWMGFRSGNRAASTLPDNFWSRFTASGVIPGHMFGLVGLLGSLVVGCGVAWRTFQRLDVA